MLFVVSRRDVCTVGVGGAYASQFDFVTSLIPSESRG